MIYDDNSSNESKNQNINGAGEGKSMAAAKSSKRKRRKGKHSYAKLEKDIEILKNKLDNTEKKLDDTYTKMVEYKNGYLRALADLENYRKSVQKELAETRERTKESLYLGIITILDNFERAMQSFKKDDVDEHTVSIMKGVEMIYNQFHNLLEKEGVKSYSSLGENFDPRKHHALMLKETEETEPGKILEEHERGYMFRNKILRPAKVIVAKKKENKSEENNTENKEEKNNGEE